MTPANMFRDSQYMKNSLGDNPGYYRWYATESDFRLLCKKLYVNFDEFSKYVEIKQNLYCIYVGIAVKESVKKRLNWHINDRHDKSSVINGTLSALRKTIASVTVHNQYDKKSTDDFIDRLFVDYIELPYLCKSKEANDEAHNFERNFMRDYACILNTQENHHFACADVKKLLRKLRRESK